MDKVVVAVYEQEDVAKARRAARAAASIIGMDKYKSGELEISTSELATNLIRYANGGTISLEEIRRDDKVGIRLVSEDRGPGISDIELALSEGYSTRKSMGSGLPGVKRMMDEFQISSKVGSGTKIEAVKWL